MTEPMRPCRDPDRHHRRSIRLQGHDYAAPGAYFVTICTINRSPLLSTIGDGEVADTRSVPRCANCARPGNRTKVRRGN